MAPWLIALISLVGLILLFVAVAELLPHHRFIDACGKDDLGPMKKWLDSGIDLNKAGWFGITALGAAVVENKLANVQLLLSRGADPNQRSAKSLPLQTAIGHDNIEMIRTLLEAGAEPDRVGLLGVTPLENAVLDGKVEVLPLLAEFGASFDRRMAGGQGEPLVHSLLYRLHGERHEKDRIRLRANLKWLLDHGVSPNTRSKEDVPLVVVALPDQKALRIIVDAGAITQVSVQGVDLEEAIKLALNESNDRES